MTVELADEDFAVVHEALRVNNAPFDMDDVAHLVALLGRAWDVVKRIGIEHGITTADMAGRNLPDEAGT